MRGNFLLLYFTPAKRLKLKQSKLARKYEMSISLSQDIIKFPYHILLYNW